MSAIFTMSTRCCCDRAPAGCSCSGVYNAWVSGYFDLPKRIKMTFDYHKPEADRVKLRCSSGTGESTCLDNGHYYDCQHNILTADVNYGESPYAWQGLSGDGACSFAGCREYNSEGECITGCMFGHADHVATYWYDFCSRTCDSACNDWDVPLQGIGEYLTTQDVDTATPMESFLEAGELHLERVVWSDGTNARVTYVFDSAYYEPGDPINDSVEWGEVPILYTELPELSPPFARSLWTVANMYNSKTSGRCTYPGIADGAGDGGPLGNPPPTCRGAQYPQNISSQHFRMFLDLTTTDDDPVCRWRLICFFWDDMNGNSICALGPNDCGNMPDTNDADHCECWGQTCDADDPCYDGNATCCVGNVGGDPCDFCGAANQHGVAMNNCCGCQAGLSGKICARWQGDNGVGDWKSDGLGSNYTPLFPFNGLYTPTDNLECFTNPFAAENFHLWGGDNGEPDGPNIRWGYSNNTIPNVPTANLNWANIVTPLDLARHRWENGIQWSLDYGGDTGATGFIRVTGFEVTEE